MTHKRRFSNLCSVFLALLCATTVIYGQAVNGTLLGTITDSTGAVVPGARVIITEMNKGVSRSAETNASGNYAFPDLEPGTYRVEVERQGFQRAVREGVAVLVNSAVRVDLVLKPGQVTETVNVTAEAPLLSTDRADTGRKIEFKLVGDLPLPSGRNFQGLLNIVPGASRTFRPHSEFFNPQDSLSTHVNGQSRLANNFLLEGIDNNERTGLLIVLVPPIEALAAVDVTTSNYEAELGRAGGAVTNAIFRSGTNQLHGSVYEFNKVSRLAARNFFATTKPVTTFNLFGATIGGPIRKNRTFFFGDYQGARDHRGDNFRPTVPTLGFRDGDFSAASSIIYNPFTGNPDGSGRRPFEGNRIPKPLLDQHPIPQKLLALIPPPLFPGFTRNYEVNTVRRKNTDSFDVKVDHLITDKNRLAVRYSFQRASIFDPPLFGLAGGGNKAFAGSALQRMQNGAINYTHIFSATSILESRFGALRYRNDAQNADLNTKASEQIGIPGVNVSPFTGGLVGIDIDNFVSSTSQRLLGYSASLPWKRAETNFNFVNNFTKIIGNHTFKIGADIRRIRDDLLQVQTFDPRGVFRFRAGQTATKEDAKTSFANAFAAFLLDLPNQYGRDLPIIFPAFRQTAIFSYVQDKWQVSPKLTLDLGLRHEFWPPATPHHPGGFSNYDPNTNTLLLAGVGNIPDDFGRETFYTYFAPRFGLAYRMNDKTVFRGAYGISYVPFPDNNYAYNFPVRQNQAFNAANSFVPAGSMASGFPPAQPAVIPTDGIIKNPPESNFDVIPRDYREGYVQSWNVAIQRALPWHLAFEAAYVANHGVRIGAGKNVNAGLIPGAGAAGQPLNQRFGRKASTTVRFIPTSTLYNSLQLKLDRRFSSGLLLTTAYTYGKSIDFVNDNGTFANKIFPNLNRARSDFDRTHVFTQSYVWELPFGPRHRWLNHGVGRWIFGDWQVNGILTAQTGFPINLEFSNATLNAPDNTQRPNLVGSGSVKVFHDVGKGVLWFDTSRFVPPPAATFGNVGRNSLLTGPGLVNLDFSLFRKFRLTERTGLEFRAESFNATNTPKFDRPGRTLGNADFGQVVQTLPNDSTAGAGIDRQFQFGLKVTF